jgi:phosphatidate phosphatase APP1
LFLKNLQKLLVAIDNWTDDRERDLIADDPQNLYIQLYNAYANTEIAFLRGRVLRKHRRFRPALPTDGIGTNLMNTYFRIYSQEVSDVRLRLHLQENMVEVVSDNEGYFSVAMPLDGRLSAGVHRCTAEVLSAPFILKTTEIAAANVFLPPADAEFGVISDIDDTTIVSKTFSPLRMLYTILCENAHCRTAVKGVPDWYNSLSANGKNPFFYVSSSPWNIYDILTQIFDLQHIPQGAIALRDYGIDPDKFFMGTHATHKSQAIDDILATYPHLNFILSGDTAQHDTEIYCAAALKHGSRIKTIYIRDVGIQKRLDYALPIIAEAKKQGTDVQLLD